MATITITNTSASPIYLRDFYTTIGPTGATNTALGPAATLTLPSNVSGNSNLSGGTNKAGRSPADVLRMVQIQELVAAGTLTLTVTPSADELASELTYAPPNTVGYTGLEEVAAATAPGVPFMIRKLYTAGVTGTADDVTIFAANSLPFKIRVLDYMNTITTVKAGATIQVFDQAAGAGNSLTAAISQTSGALVRNTSTAGSLVTAAPGASVGLFIRRSDRACAGELVLWCRRES